MTEPGAPRHWLLTGATGMLGRDLQTVLAERCPADPVTATDVDDLDITDPVAVAAAVATADVVVNCAAWTNVDGAEAAEGPAFTVNALGPSVLAGACADAAGQPWMLHISTDYVFSGDATEPYPEDAPMHPRSAYGRTKAAGEWAVRTYLPDRSWILRTAWLYGWHGSSFVATILRLLDERDHVDVVTDQHGQPTWTVDLAHRVVDTVTGPAPAGTYHATGSGQTTWYDLARVAAELTGRDPERVQPTTSDAFPRPAPRPAYSVLAHDGWARAGLAPMRPWDEALREALEARQQTSD